MSLHQAGDFGSTLRERGTAAARTAGEHSAAVDAQGRFPQEAIAALKASRLMGAMLPVDLGGEGASLADVAEVCCLLGQHCASTAMVFAMHQIQVSSLVSHARTSDWHCGFLRTAAEGQYLLASATTEAGVGGDVRTSLCAVETANDIFHLEKNASVISYGSEADAILVTARREPNSPPSDQVLVVVLRDQRVLERTSSWNTLGMRGTCSDGFKLKASGPAAQVLPRPFAEISSRSMLATSHLVWASLWYGIALSAVLKAQAFVRGDARRNRGEVPAGALRLAEAAADLQLMKSATRDGLRRFEHAQTDEAELSSMAFAIAMNNVKLSASRLGVDIVNKAMLVCGIAGFRNDTPYSVGRQYRDILSAQLMINNDRIFGHCAAMLLMLRLDAQLVA